MLRKYFPKNFRDVYTIKFLLAVFFFAALDILTKYLASNYLVFRQPTNIIGDTLRFTLVGNTGAIFGTFSNNLLPSTIIMFFAIILLVILYWKENENLGSSFAWMLVMGGALGNFIDKLFRKTSLNPNNLDAETGWSFIFLDPKPNSWVGVVDFIDVDLPSFLNFMLDRWFIFNMADTYISVGVGLLIISLFRMRKKRKV
jgi:signal peptidase II